jgi:hypothetical protein
MLSLVVHERGQSARPVVLYEQAVLDVRVGLPEKGYSDRIAPHHRIEKAFRLLRIPNEVALDCRQHDFTLATWFRTPMTGGTAVIYRSPRTLVKIRSPGRPVVPRWR